MVKANGAEFPSVAPFLTKCYDMVNDESTNYIISWGGSNNSFIIWNMTDLTVKLLPKYFKHSNFSSFLRQLNIYGFRKVDADRWEFANCGFLRDEKHLLKNITRRKNAQLSSCGRKLAGEKQVENSLRPPSQENSADQALWKEMEILKADKNALMQELGKLRQHQETAESKLLLLRDWLEGMEKSEKQLLSFLIMILKNPEFLMQFLHLKEGNWHIAERTSLAQRATDDLEPVPCNGMICSAPAAAAIRESPQICSEFNQDLFLSPEFIKVLMDEDLPPRENNLPFLLPELQDDGSWEQLFLASPFLENAQHMNHDGEETLPDTHLSPSP